MLTTTAEPIKAYSPGHLIICLFVILLVILSVRILKGAEKNRVIFATGILLAALEVIKQFMMPQIYGNYSWSDFPFQLCSIPMYLCLLYPVCKRGRTVIELFLSSFGLLGAIAAFAVPYDVFSKYLLLSLHSIIWHTVLLFLGSYCIAVRDRDSRVSGRNIRDTALLYLGLAILAVCINALLFRTSGGDANMFFLGPAKPYVGGLNEIYEKRGWIAESIVMICASELAGIGLLLLGEALRKRFKRK